MCTGRAERGHTWVAVRVRAYHAALTFMSRDFHAIEVPQDSGEEEKSG
jgi:hypothetical protein